MVFNEENNGFGTQFITGEKKSEKLVEKIM